MIIKILFFDTSVLLKMFVEEIGTENVKWLTSPDTKFYNGLQFVVNDQVCLEFEKKINQFAKIGKISKEKADHILYIFANHYKNIYFLVIGQKPISNSKQETSIDTICQELKLKSGKNDWDAFIYQSIIDALAFFDDESHPILVTCDVPFGNKVKSKGYRVIDPIRQSCNEIQMVFAQPRRPER